MNSLNRIQKEINKIKIEPIPNIDVIQNINNLRELFITMDGPKDTPYLDGKFKLEMFLNEDYPMKPPKIRFLTKIYHPNIDKIGRICMNILKSDWTPALQIRTILLSLQSLLYEPNISDPLDPTIGKHWIEDKEDAIKKAKEMTKLYATFN
jgi:ubiquitin-conjugating enzyme E2 N